MRPNESNKDKKLGLGEISAFWNFVTENQIINQIAQL